MDEQIEEWRREIDLCDFEISILVVKRAQLAKLIREQRIAEGEIPLDLEREALVRERFLAMLPSIRKEDAEQIIEAIMQSGRDVAKPVRGVLTG